jgi:micrococcal nuclease
MESVVNIMYEYKIVEVVKVVDGDTVDIVIDVGFNMYRKERIRINRIDTPESSTSNLEEKKIGILAKEFVNDWLRSQITLKIKTIKDDKYGRILGEIYGDDNICLNDLLLENGLAWEYDGTSKKKDLSILLEKRKSKEKS